jgi:hypothetical protein
MENTMPDENLEAHYHFTLSAMMDLITQYGYSKVLQDLDNMIADKLEEDIFRALMEEEV